MRGLPLFCNANVVFATRYMYEHTIICSVRKVLHATTVYRTMLLLHGCFNMHCWKLEHENISVIRIVDWYLQHTLNNKLWILQHLEDFVQFWATLVTVTQVHRQPIKLERFWLNQNIHYWFVIDWELEM